MTHRGEIRLIYKDQVIKTHSYHYCCERIALTKVWKAIYGPMFNECSLQYYPEPDEKKMDKIIFSDVGNVVIL